VRFEISTLLPNRYDSFAQEKVVEKLSRSDLSFSPTRTTILTSQGFDDYSGCYSLIEMPSVRSYQPGDSQIVGTLPMVDYSEDMLSSRTVES